MEILTILEPSTVNLEPTSRRTDKLGLTASDVAAALAGANKAGLALLLGQICGTSEYNAIYGLFWPETIKLANRLNWRTDEPTLVRMGRLLDIVLSESILSKKCPSCRGTKYSFINPADPCPTCKGTGLNINFDYLKAQYLEISDRAWRKTWRERERDIKALLDRRSYQAKRKIISNLYEKLDG